MMNLSIASRVYTENRILRNTFLLLALSFIPTILGVLAGIAMGVPAYTQENPWSSLLLMLLGGVILIFGTMAFAESVLGVLLFLAFSGFEGMVISGVIDHVLTLENGPTIIMNALAGTSLITLGCSIYAMVTKRDFSMLGGFLFGGLLALIGLMILGMVFGFYGTWISYLAIPLFSLYLVFDVQRVVSGGEKNYVSAALAIYLDVLNIFLHLLNILSSDD